MKKYLFLSILFFSPGTLLVFSQVPDEKIHLQTDRDFYVPGETISFKVFVLTDLDTIYSSNLFVELWDDSLRKRAEMTLPVTDGTGSGSISIPRELKASQLFLRAYTDITARQQHPYQFVKTIMRAIPGETSPDDKAGDRVPVFFPEGGRLVYNALNYVAFKARKDLSGTVRNSKGEKVAVLNPSFNGLGAFILTPEKGETYSAYWEEHGKPATVPLPLPVENGIALHIKQTPDTLFLDLDNGGTKDPDLLKIKIHLLISNEIAYVVELNMSSRAKFSYFIPLEEYRAGMAELQVIGMNDQLLARRSLFINRHSLTIVPEIEMIKQDLSKRGENILKLHFKDTTLRYVSMRITDAGYSQAFSGSGLAASLISMERSTALRTEYNISNPEELDLALQTSDMGSPVNNTALPYSPVAAGKYLQLHGVVMKGRKVFAGKNLLVGVRSAYTGKDLYKVHTNDQGKFVVDGVIAYGETYVHCRIPGNEAQELTCTYSLVLPEVKPGEEFYNQFEKTVKSLLPVNKEMNHTAGFVTADTDPLDTLAFSDKVITLAEVVLKSSSSVQARVRLQELEEKYIAGGPFSGYSATGETLDVMNDPGSIRYFDIFNYIRANMHRVDVRMIRGAKQLIYFGRGITGETIVSTFYINNSIAERNMLDGISLDQVAAIKFVPNLVTVKEMPPALAIFLKKPGDQGYWEKDRFQVFEQKMNGYPVSKEFKEPDYSNVETKVESDWRKTILWKPFLTVDKGVAGIRFFNTDRTKKVRIVMEGMAEDGSLIYFEKVIE